MGSQTGILALAAATLLAAAPALGEPPTVSGFLQTQATTGIDGNSDDHHAPSSFAVRRLRLRVTGQVTPTVGYVVMFDPSTPGNLLRDGYLKVTLPGGLELRAGQQKTVFGWENPETSTRLPTVDRALVSDALGRGPDVRDLGLGLYGKWPNGGDTGVEAAVTLVNGAGPNRMEDNDNEKNVWGRAGGFATLHDLKLRAGVSAAAGSHPLAPTGKAQPTDFRRFGVDVELDHPYFALQAEAIASHDESGAQPLGRRGGFVTLVGKLPGHAGPVARWEALDPDTGTGGDRIQRWTLGAWWEPVAHLRLLADFELDRSDVRRDHLGIVWVQAMF